MNYDIYLVGVGGQGVLTIGEILVEAAQAANLAVNFCPSRGMAQRGGFVKAQLRLGRERVGPNIPERGADLVMALERSEALKAVRFAKQGGSFILMGEVWSPTAVLLGKAGYPTLDQVSAQVEASGADFIAIDPACLPVYAGQPVPANIFTLGVAIQQTPLKALFSPEALSTAIQKRWKHTGDINLSAFQEGLKYRPAVAPATAEAASR